jgi:hypothetical protein
VDLADADDLQQPEVRELAERERRQVGPEGASSLVHSGGSTAIKGYGWPDFWASVAPCSLGRA